MPPGFAAADALASSSSRTPTTLISTTHTPTTIRTLSTARRSSWSRPRWQPPAVQREVVYPNGKYVLYGDGVNQPYQWVWIPAAPPPPVPE